MIDFRSAGHYDTLGHIEGAVNWTMANLADNVGQIPSGAKVICICYTGQTASHATSYLQMMGYNAWNLKWGMCGWTGDETVNRGLWANLTPTGHATETTPHALSTEYTFPTLEGATAEDCIHDHCNAFFDGGLKTITADNLYANLNDGDSSNDPFILNYWSEADYNAGHIPGSFQFAPGSLGTTEMLKYLPTNKQIVAWCYTGQTSAQVSTYLNMLGYNCYSLLYGMNSINTSLCGTNVYHAPTTDYPVVTGTAS
jgi:rhodanese-related sulfurtransferase